ncbi:MAG: ribonuclease P protein component [Actinobacteria bacterium]|nr:ribonuclease P protein component [Actinomycetota bacterium]
MKIIFETLKKNSDFESFRKRNVQVNSEYFKVILIKLDDSSDRLRLGYVVSKKIGKAVERNKLKRQIKEIFRNLQKINKDSFNILIIAKKPIMNLGFNSLKDQILKSLQPYLQTEQFD